MPLPRQTEIQLPNPPTTGSMPASLSNPAAPKATASKRGKQAELPAYNTKAGYTQDYLYKLMLDSIEADATDIHLCCGSQPMRRINLDLKPIPGLQAPLDDEQILSFFDLLLTTGFTNHNCEVVRENLRIQGWADFAFSVEAATSRGNIYKNRTGYAMALRFFHRKHINLDFLDMRHMIEFGNWEQGLILLTGPTGSAKTTVASALLEWLNTHSPIHIATIEDPVEYPIQGNQALITQRSLTDHHVLSFAEGLKSLLRQDPDLIMIGEVRDREVLRQVFSAAETGHLVITTMHAGSISDCFARMTGMFEPEEQDRIRTTLAGINTVVVNQRLVHSTTTGHAELLHELFHNREIDGAFSTIRDGAWVNIQNMQITGANSGMRHWDKEAARLVREGRITRAVGETFARDKSFFQHLLDTK